MPNDPELVAETRAWMSRALLDLRVANHGFSADPPLLEDILFHSQQAVEKCFKALLCWNSVIFRKTHSLEELGEACLHLDPSLRPLVDRAVPLTEYAWKFRYPGDDHTPSTKEATRATAIAREVYEAVAARLPPEVKP